MPQPRPLGGSECEEKRDYCPAGVCGAPSCQLCQAHVAEPARDNDRETPEGWPCLRLKPLSSVGS